MPSTLTYPGVYVEEIPSGVRTITPVSTSTTAFVDFFARGPLGTPVRVTSQEQFDATFGGLHPSSEASYAIRQFFLNGGSIAWVVRVAAGGAEPAELTLQNSAGDGAALTIRASSPGEWANTAVQVAVVNAPNDRFNLFVRQVVVEDGAVVTGPGDRPKVIAAEAFRNLSMDPASPDFVVDALSASMLVRGADPGDDPPAGATGTASGEPDEEEEWTEGTGGSLAGGTNGTVPTSATDVEAGMRTLDGIAPAIFNILCLPIATTMDDANRRALYDAAVVYCVDKRAFLIVDVPDAVRTPADMVDELGNLPPDDHCAVYFPRLRMPDPLNAGRPRSVGASGTVAGIYATTDATRGVWKAPAGTEALVRNATLALVMTDGDNGALNPLGVNAIRNFPVFNSIVWGARTLAGADQRASEWKYIPVRRTALFIEESLFQGLKWVVFEPNDEPLWAQIRLNVGAFMNDLFRQGAFQGRNSREAYFVKCDGDTTTQNDINRGVVNVVVGFSPLRPAEFVVLQIQQMAGQIEV